MLCCDHTDDDDNPTPIPELVLLRPVPTRWNTMTEVLTHALTLQPVLTTLCERAQFNKRDGVRLRRFVLEDEEWELLQQLAPILEVCVLQNFYFISNILVAIPLCYKASLEELSSSDPPCYSIYRHTL